MSQENIVKVMLTKDWEIQVFVSKPFHSLPVGLCQCCFVLMLNCSQIPSSMQTNLVRSEMKNPIKFVLNS